MTAIAAVLALLAAVLAVFAARERRLRRAAERRAPPPDDDATRRRIVGVAAHELRSPISVVLGYQELLADGLYGELDPRGREALERIRQAIEQQLRVLDGIVEMAGGGTTAGDPAPIDLDAVVRTALDDASAFAASHGVTLDERRTGTLPRIVADQTRFRRALDMAFAAAIKASGGHTLTVTIEPADDGATLTVAGTGLQPARDEPGGQDGAPLDIASGPALRIALARQALGSDAGRVDLHPAADTATLAIRLRGTRRSD